MLLRLLKTLELPPNPLDEMIDKMGGIDHVAELTGRQVTGCVYAGAYDFKLQTSGRQRHSMAERHVRAATCLQSACALCLVCDSASALSGHACLTYISNLQESSSAWLYAGWAVQGR